MTMNVYARANPDRLRGAVESLDRAASKSALEAHNSRKEVEKGKLALAAGGENQTYPEERLEVKASAEKWRRGELHPRPPTAPERPLRS